MAEELGGAPKSWTHCTQSPCTSSHGVVNCLMDICLSNNGTFVPSGNALSKAFQKCTNVYTPAYTTDSPINRPVRQSQVYTHWRKSSPISLTPSKISRTRTKYNQLDNSFVFYTFLQQQPFFLCQNGRSLSPSFTCDTVEYLFIVNVIIIFCSLVVVAFLQFSL